MNTVNRAHFLSAPKHHHDATLYKGLAATFSPRFHPVQTSSLELSEGIETPKVLKRLLVSERAENIALR